MTTLGVVAAFDGRPGRDMAALRECARRTEGLGYSSFWVPEHVVFFEHYESRYPYNETGTLSLGRRPGVYDPLVALTVAASVTTTLRLGTGILIVPQREPVTLAQQVVAVDHASDGRLDLGIGVGWSHEEFAALGVSWARRGARTDDHLRAMKTLWAKDIAAYDGEFTSFSGVIAEPKPVQTPHPPLWVGGNTEAALRRTAQLGDGWYGWAIPQSEMAAAVARLHAACEAEGRDPVSVRITLGLPWPGDVDGLAGYLAAAATAGVEEVAVALARPRTALADRLAQLAVAVPR